MSHIGVYIHAGEVHIKELETCERDSAFPGICYYRCEEAGKETALLVAAQLVVAGGLYLAESSHSWFLNWQSPMTRVAEGEGCPEGFS